MFYTNFELSTKTLKIIAIITSIIGAIFVLAANHVGNFAIRIAMIVASIVFIVNIRMTYRFSGKLKKTADIFCLIGAIIVLIFPQLLVFILGIALLFYCNVSLFEFIKSKNYRDKIKPIFLLVGIVLSIFCIINSKGTLTIVIKLLGAILVSIGCVCFYQYIIKTRKQNSKPDEYDEYKFESAEEIEQIIEVQEFQDINEDK